MGSTVETTIELTDATGLVDATDMSWLHEHTARATSLLACKGGLRVRIVADQEMAAAHEEFAGVSGTTDVLTFDMSDPEGDRTELDADVMICLDEARRQSTERGHPARHELLLYILHAVLHCLGEADDTDSGYRSMHAREDSVLTTMGVGPIFGDRGGFQPH